MEVQTDDSILRYDRISLPSRASHENPDLRSGLLRLGAVPGPVLNRTRKRIFLLPSTIINSNYCSSASVLPTDYNMSQPGRSPLYVLSFSCRGHLAALGSPRLICQLLCIFTPYRLGSAIGRPGRLVTHVPSFPPA